MADVYAWVLECLSRDAQDTSGVQIPVSKGVAKHLGVGSKSGRGDDKAGSGPAPAWAFELYTSPPYRLFDPLAAGATLAELQLVPAAVVNLNWRDGALFSADARALGAKGHVVASSSAIAAAATAVPSDAAAASEESSSLSHDAGSTIPAASFGAVDSLGSYLADHLLLQAEGKSSSGTSSSRGSAAFPTGEKLVVSDPAASDELRGGRAAASSSGTMGADGLSGASQGKAEGKSGVGAGAKAPRWLKTGR